MKISPIPLLTAIALPAILATPAMPAAAQEEEGPEGLLGLAQSMVSRYERVAATTAKSVASACEESGKRCLEHLSVRLWSLEGARTAMEVTLEVLEERWPEADPPLKKEWPKRILALNKSISEMLDVARKHDLEDAIRKRMAQLFEDDMTYHVFDSRWAKREGQTK